MVPMGTCARACSCSVYAVCQTQRRQDQPSRRDRARAYVVLVRHCVRRGVVTVYVYISIFWASSHWFPLPVPLAMAPCFYYILTPSGNTRVRNLQSPTI